MSPQDLYPSSTSICDFAYEKDHPLRHGHYPSSAESSELEDSDYCSDSSPYSQRYEDSPQSSRVINLRAIALFDFTPENDNEIELYEGQSVWITYRHGQGWLVAEDVELGRNGLVPEEYVEFVFEEPEFEDDPKPFMPQFLRQLDEAREEEWEDVDEDDSHTKLRSLRKSDDVEKLQGQFEKAGIN